MQVGSQRQAYSASYQVFIRGISVEAEEKQRLVIAADGNLCF